MRRPTYRMAAIVLLLTVIVGVVSTDAQRRRRRAAKRSQPAKAAKVQARRTPTQETQLARGTLKIVSTSFALPPGYLQQYPIFIPPNAGGGRVFGNFRATSGDNVQVHVLDSDGLENLRHRSQYRSFYESGRVTVGTIDLTLPPGQYFLVFENLYSVFSNKIVWADVNLEY